MRMSDNESTYTHIHADGTVHSHAFVAGEGEEVHAHVHTNTKAVKNRLARVIGHLHAVERMVNDERDCAEILIQLAAVRSALASTSKLILKDHMEHCIVDAIEEHDETALKELERAIDSLLK